MPSGVETTLSDLAITRLLEYACSIPADGLHNACLNPATLKMMCRELKRLRALTPAPQEK
jgi:hypothetical protein